MSISASTILNRVNQITKFDETDIDEILKEVLIEISVRSKYLKSSTTGTLSADTDTISNPSDMVQDGVDELYLDSDLLSIMSFADWRANKVKGYAQRGDYIYVRPTPNTDKSYTLYYSKKHASSTTVEYPDEFQSAIVWGCVYKLYDNYSMQDEANNAETKYERELAKLTPSEGVTISRIPNNTRI